MYDWVISFFFFEGGVGAAWITSYTHVIIHFILWYPQDEESVEA